MKILLTGASSFTGFWFAKTLADSGHRVTACYRREAESLYTGTRRRRVSELGKHCEQLFLFTFGEKKFLDLCAERSFDVFCHHGAQVSDYKSQSFDARAAFLANTLGAEEALERLKSGGCNKVLLSCSVFEGGRGAGDENTDHVSPYGLSKSLTADFFRFQTRRRDIGLCEFVIANPFGPMEEPKFTAYLFRCWLSGQVPTVRTPIYVRDNIPVTLLANHYRTCIEADQLPDLVEPSGYVGTQLDFALRVSRAASLTLGQDCPIQSANQTAFPEPITRINRGPSLLTSSWPEEKFWNDFVLFHRELYKSGV